MTSRPDTGFWLVALTFLIAMAFSTVPTPLYPLYAQQNGFSSLTITVVFATYALGVVASLITVGHVSDWVGRRRVLVAALAAEVVAGLLFVASTALPALVAGRFITGLGVGAVTATATAYLHELHALARPGGDNRRFEIVSGVANIGGLGVGPLVAGALAQWAPWPLQTSYVVFVALLVLAAVLVGFAPETVVVPRSERPAYRPQRMTVSGPPLGWAVAAGSAFSAFAVFGVFTSLAPGFVGGTLGHPGRILAGAVVFLVFAVAPVAQHWSARLAESSRLGVALAGECAGLVLLATAMEAASLVLFLVGGAVSGAAAGVLVKSAIAHTVRTAPAGARGEALAGLFLVAYTGLVAPVLALGIATRLVAATSAMIGFSTVLVALLACVAAAAHRDQVPVRNDLRGAEHASRVLRSVFRRPAR